jgi:ribosomal protein L11 methyltransferase
MDYIKLTCNIISENQELVCHLLTQELADLGFESFEEFPNMLLAYIPEKDFTDQVKESLPPDILSLGRIEYSPEQIKDRNWNEEWEKNFQPVVIADKCYIRAHFHERRENVPYEIIIEPKMAFGTGHHETTSLMVEQMLLLDFTDKQVLDMGCGTGVLGIMASKLQAKHILAIDIDEWAYNNTLENCSVNHITNISATQGDIDKIQNHRFDIILANINRNILIRQLPSYANALPSGGLLLMSGIYTADANIIQQSAADNGFSYIRTKEKNNWAAILFVKR